MGQEISKQLQDGTRIQHGHALPVLSPADIRELLDICERKCIGFQINRTLVETDALSKYITASLCNEEGMLDYRLFVGIMCAFTTGPFSQRLELCLGIFNSKRTMGASQMQMDTMLASLQSCVVKACVVQRGIMPVMRGKELELCAEDRAWIRPFSDWKSPSC